MNSHLRDDASRDPDVLKREADMARAHVSDTLDAIQQKLSPGQLLDQMTALVQRHGGEAARNLGHSVKQNPLATILTGIGIAWLMASNRSSEAEPYASAEPYPLTGDGRAEAEEFESSSPGVEEKLRGAASNVRSRVSDAKHRVGDAASSFSERAHYARARTRAQTDRAREGFARMMDEQPLLLGLFGIAIGAALGASLPSSRREDELLGGARDRVMGAAAEFGSQQVDRVREAASDDGAATRDDPGIWPHEGEAVPQQHH